MVCMRISVTSHPRLREFVTLARTIRRYRHLILNTLDHGPSNTCSTATNTPPTGIDQRAYGFDSPDTTR